MSELKEAERAAEYLGAVRGTWPLVILASAIAMASALRQLRRGYKQRTWREQLVSVLLNALLTTAMAVSGAILLPILMPDITPAMQLACASILAGLGGETVKLFIIHRLGLSVVDLMDPNDINEVRKSMPPDVQRRHLEQCPFRCDDDEHVKCPHV